MKLKITKTTRTKEERSITQTDDDDDGVPRLKEKMEPKVLGNEGEAVSKQK